MTGTRPWTRRKSGAAIALAVFTFTVVAVPFAVRPARAQFGSPFDPAIAAGTNITAANAGTTAGLEIKDSTWRILLTNLTNTAVLAILNAGQYFAQKIAYDLAVYAASGGEGQKPLFETKGWKEYLKDVGRGAAATALQSVSSADLFQKLGLNLCNPTDPRVALRIKLGYIDGLPGILGGPVNSAPTAPSCTAISIIENWDSYWATKDWEQALDQVGVMFEPGQSSLGVALSFNSYARELISEERQKAIAERIKTDFKPLTTHISGRIKTPAENIQEEMVAHNQRLLKEKKDLEIGMTWTAISQGAFGIIPAFFQTFTNTLTEKLMKKVFERGLISYSDLFLDQTDDIFKNFGAAPPVGGRQAAELANASFLTPRILTGTNYDELTDFATCPSTAAPSVSNCVIDSQFHIAVNRSTQDAPVTVRQALQQGFLRGNWPLIPPNHPKNVDKNCFQNGYCHGNLVKLRKARILPIGWELAAASPFNNASNPVTLKEVVDRFNDCPVDQDGDLDVDRLPDPLHPWCHLIDPDWVIKYPKTTCRQQAVGPTLLSPQGDVRARSCVDSVSCIAEDASGDCVGGYGYCLRERNVWKLDADFCPAHYASCQTVRRADGNVVSYNMNTVHAGVCDAENAGCRSVGTVKNAVPNPGFEDVFENQTFPRGWTGTGAVFGRSELVSFKGRNAVAVTSAPGSNARADIPSVLPGKQLKLQGAAKLDLSEGGRTASVRVQFLDRAGDPVDRACLKTTSGGLPKTCVDSGECEPGDSCEEIQIETTCAPTAGKTVTLEIAPNHLGYTAGSCEVTTPANAASATMTLSGNPGPGNRIWFDDVGLYGQTFSGDPLDGLFLNAKAQSCSGNQVGCTELIPITASTLNLIRNSGFEDADALGETALYWQMSPDQYEGQAFSGFEGASAAVLTGAGAIRQSVRALHGEATYVFSVFAKHDAAGGSGSTAGYASLQLRDAAGAAVEPTSIAGGCAASGSAIRLDLPTGAGFQRVDCQFTTSVDADRVDIELRKDVADGERLLVDAAQLELAVQSSAYHEGHGASGGVFLRKAPAGVQCSGAPEDPPECGSFAPSCRREEVGCNSYAPASGGTAIPAVVSQSDYCPAVCSGYATFRQEPTNFKDAKFPVFFIPGTAKACLASQAGCEEFTNIEELARGGEARSAFTYLRLCSKLDDQTSTYYTWEGSDQSGYQLRVWSLRRSDISSPATGQFGSDPTGGVGPCTSLRYDALGNPACNDAAVTDNPALCNKFQTQLNPDCREFYDADGNIHYRLYSKTILATDDCKQFRATVSTETECLSHGGFWRQDECRYLAHAPESLSCPVAAVGCKAYAGNAARNIRQAMNDTFESGTSDGWSQAADADPVCTTGTPSACNSNESITAGGHSLKATSPAIHKKATTLVRLGKHYLLTFWAKGGGDLTVRFSSAADAPFTFNRSTSQPAPLALSTEWKAFTVGPVRIVNAPAADERLIFENAGAGDARPLYLDNILLQEVSESIYVVQDSWNTPAVCDQTPSGVAAPQYMLGCQAYADRLRQTVHLRSFDRLCRPEAVGCEAFYDTRNTDSPYAQTFNAVCSLPDGPDAGSAPDACVPGAGSVTCPCAAPVGGKSAVVCAVTVGSTSCQYDSDDDAGNILTSTDPIAGHISPDGDTVRVPQDAIVYLINDARFRCDSAGKGCAAVGEKTLNQDGDVIVSWTERFLKNLPSDYERMLCTKPEEFCQAYTRREDNTPLYFKDPGNHLCAYRENVSVGGFNVSGWFKKGLDEPCYPDYLQAGNFYNVWKNSDSAYEGWVAECEGRFSMCKEFIDPQDISSGTPDGKPYYAILNARLDTKSCQNRVSLLTGPSSASDASACVLFRQTDVLTLPFDSQASYAASDAKAGALADAVPGAANDSNLVIRVKRDRQCGEWLDCRSSETVWNPTTGTFQTVCTGYGVCEAFQRIGDSTRCVKYASGRTPEVLTSRIYQSRDTGWAAQEYAGFSIPNRYAVSDLVTVDVSIDASRPEPRLVFTSGKCTGAYGSTCGPTNNLGNRGTCLGPAGKRWCVFPVDGGRPADSSGDLLQAAGKIQYPPTSCRAYPEDTSPFPAEVADPNGWNDDAAEFNAGNPVFISANAAFAGAKVCQRRLVDGKMVSSCECSYQSATYGSANSASGKRYFSLADSSLPAGYCSGGVYEGYECDPTATGLRTKTNASCCNRLVDIGDVETFGQVSVTLPCAEPARCEPLVKVDRVIGYEGQCLERDATTPINNRPDEFACVTWRPVGLVGGTRDIYNLYQTAGYFAPPDRRFYCVGEKDRWVVKLDIPTEMEDGGGPVVDANDNGEVDGGDQVAKDANGDGKLDPSDLPTFKLFGPGKASKSVPGYASRGGNCSNDADQFSGVAWCIYPGLSEPSIASASTAESDPGSGEEGPGGGEGAAFDPNAKYVLTGPPLGILGCYEVSDVHGVNEPASIEWPYIGPPIYQEQLESVFFQIADDIYDQNDPDAGEIKVGRVCVKTNPDLGCPAFEGGRYVNYWITNTANIPTNPYQDVVGDCNDDSDDNIDPEDDDSDDARIYNEAGVLANGNGYRGIYHLKQSNSWKLDASDGEGSILLEAKFDANGKLSSILLKALDNSDEGTFGIKSMGFIFKKGCDRVVRVDEPGEFGLTKAYTDVVNSYRDFSGFGPYEITDFTQACRPWGSVGSILPLPSTAPWTYVAGHEEYDCKDGSCTRIINQCTVNSFRTASLYREYDPSTFLAVPPAAGENPGLFNTVQYLFRKIFGAWRYVEWFNKATQVARPQEEFYDAQAQSYVDGRDLTTTTEPEVAFLHGPIRPPKVAPVDVTKCDANNVCPAGPTDTVTVNGRNTGIIVGTEGVLQASVRFYAWASHNTMPILSRRVIWGDATPKEPQAKGWYKNQKPFCSAGTSDEGAVNECRGFPGMTCRTNADCPGTACDGLDRFCANDRTRDCTKDSDCTGGSVCVNENHFGNTPGACAAAPVQFDHVYTCSLADLKLMPVCDGADDQATNAPCRRRLDNVWNCVYQPGVQVIDNWGWCNCTGSGCYEGAGNHLKASDPKKDCDPSDVTRSTDPKPWTPFKGELRVLPTVADSQAFIATNPSAIVTGDIVPFVAN